MTHFCDNPLCPHHIEFDGRPMELEFMEDMSIRRYKAHLHGTVHLCDTCHQAVQLVVNAGKTTVTA